MSYCKTIKEKYKPYLGEVHPYGSEFVWKGYYRNVSNSAYHGISFSQKTEFVPDEERESRLNKYLIKHEKSQMVKSDASRYWGTSSTSWGNNTYTNITFTIG